jgi:hypothetical protein
MTYYCPSSARAHRSKHRTWKTEMSPLGSFCQKAQPVSQYKTPLFLYGPLSTGFLRDHRNRCCGEEENQGIIKWRKSYIRFSHFDFPAVQPRKTSNLLEHAHTRHHGGDRKRKDGGHSRVVFVVRRRVALAPLAFSCRKRLKFQAFKRGTHGTQTRPHRSSRMTTSLGLPASSSSPA